MPANGVTQQPNWLEKPSIDNILCIAEVLQKHQSVAVKPRLEQHFAFTPPDRTSPPPFISMRAAEGRPLQPRLSDPEAVAAHVNTHRFCPPAQLYPC